MYGSHAKLENQTHHLKSKNKHQRPVGVSVKIEQVVEEIE